MSRKPEIHAMQNNYAVGAASLIYGNVISVDAFKIVEFHAFKNVVCGTPLEGTDEAREWLKSLAINRNEIESTASQLLERCTRLERDKARGPAAKRIKAVFEANARVHARAVRGLNNNELRRLAKDPGLINDMMHDGDMTYNEYVKKILEETFASLSAECDAVRTDIGRLEAQGGANGSGSV